MFDRLETADRLTELLTYLGVLRSGVQRPSGDSGRLGRQHRRGQVLEPAPRDRQAGGRRSGHRHPRQWAGEVRGRQGFDGDARTGRIHQHDRITHRQQQQPGVHGAQHIVGRAGDTARIIAQIGLQSDARRDNSVRKLLQHSAIRDQQRGKRSTGDRTWHQCSGGFLDHDAEILDGPARPTGLFRNRHPEQSQLNNAVIDLPPSLRTAVLDIADRAGGTRPSRPSADQIPHGELFVCDGGGHLRSYG